MTYTVYDASRAPNPRRVRMFLAEKGVDVNYVQLDIQKGENLSPAMLAKNPMGKLPILELADGTCISETDAICTYIEAMHPEPPLLGATPLEKGIVGMWQRRVDQYLMLPVTQCFQHSTGYFKDRMTPVPAFGEQAGKDVVAFLDILDAHLGESDFIAGDAFTVADIIALCAIDFARVVKIRLAEHQENLKRWHQLVSARASASA